MHLQIHDCAEPYNVIYHFHTWKVTWKGALSNSVGGYSLTGPCQKLEKAMEGSMPEGNKIAKQCAKMQFQVFSF